MSSKAAFISSLVLFVPGLVLATDNPFDVVRDRYQWAIEELGQYHQPPKFAGPTRKRTAQVAVPFKTQTLEFGTETDKAKIEVTLTSLDGGFILDLSSDQAIQGWILRRQSTRQVFGKGVASGARKLRIRVNRPYFPDFGITVFVTEDSDPAYVRLF